MVDLLAFNSSIHRDKFNMLTAKYELIYSCQPVDGCHL